MHGPPDQTGLLREAIRQILLHDWDPIGISDEPGAEGEYDDYVAEIRAMLLRTEPRQRIMDHLNRIETEDMGLCGDPSRAAQAVDRLIKLRCSQPESRH